MNRGLLEEEFNAWYDSEHLPERLAIPGFRSARRWVHERTYLATYELDSPQVLKSPAYLARFQNQTSWSKRCLGKTLQFKRWACEQIEPGGDADPHPAARGLAFSFQSLPLPSVLQMRRFAAESGEKIALYELYDLQQPGAIVYRLYES
jgi:hypothetical protein